MSEKKGTKENDNSAERTPDSSEGESTRTNLVEQMSSLPSTDSSSNQPSQKSEEPSTSAGANLPEISVTAAAGPSRFFTIRKKVASYFRNLGSKKDVTDVSRSPPKKSTLSVVDFITSAVDVFRKSPEKTSLVNADYESPPPAEKPKKEFYCKIDTFVDREGKPKQSGNTTDSTSLGTSEEVSSPSTIDKTPEESSPTEESPLLKPPKEPSPRKDGPSKK